MKNSKAFTLIELLAIIVILAVIAVITVPIILGVIDDAKKNAAKDSAYAYKKAISQYCYSKIMNDLEYVIPDGEYEISFFKNDGLVVGGQEPSDGWVIVKDKNVTDFSFLIGDYAVTYNSETDIIRAVKNGELALTPTMQLRENAKLTALAIVSGETGSTGISDISQGWVAFIDGELKAYSVSVIVNDKSFVVTDNNVEYVNNTISVSNAIANEGTEIASKTNAEQAIVLYKSDLYVKAALVANSSLTDEIAKTVAEMSDVTTNQPDSGWIHFNILNNNVVVQDYSLMYGTLTANYSSLTDGDYVSIFGSSRNMPLLLIGVLKNDGAKYLTEAQVIYYNPTTGSKCNSNDAVSTLGTTTGCLKWYLYSFKGNYVNMLLDHNISAYNDNQSAWALEDDYKAGLTEKKDESNNVIGYLINEGEGSKAISAGITFPPTITSFPLFGDITGQNEYSRGPITALNSLKSLTSAWSGTQTPKVPNSTSTNEHIIPSSDNDNRYIIDYTGYNARIITKKEAEYIGCTTSSNSCPVWMADNLESSSNHNLPYGYWTSFYSNTSYNRAFYVSKTLNLSRYYITGTYAGVRPVITVLKSDVM